MTETLGRAAELWERGEAHVLATVVRVDRPVSAKPGDRALITADGRLEGWVGGSCSEPIVVRESLAALAEGAARLVRIRPARSPREPAQPGVVTEVTTCASQGGLDVFVEPRLPRPHLVVVGSSPTARALVRLANVLDYRITGVVEDPSGGLPNASTIALSDLGANELGAEDAVVVATMNRYDELALERALRSGAGYVGLVASGSRGAHVAGTLRSRGVTDEELARLTTPAGLDLGRSTQEEIALAILAEVVHRRHQIRTEPGEPICPEQEGAGEAVDPVCGMLVRVLPSTVSAKHRGTTYHFCAPGCREEFLSEPSRFVAMAR